MAGKPKMVNLLVEETSGVDHPAHLHEGWMVMKAASRDAVDEVFDSLTEQKEAPVPQSQKVAASADEAAEVTMESLQEQLAKAHEEIAALKAAAEDDPADAPAEDGEPADEAEKPEDEPSEEAPSEDDVLKSAPESVVKMVEALRADAASARAELAKEREDKADAAAVAKVREWGNLTLDADRVGPALRRLAVVDADLAKSVEDALSAANAQAESAEIFREIGKSSGPLPGSAEEKAAAIAKAKFDKGEAPTMEQALTQVWVSNPDLYTQHMAEKGA